MTSPVNLLMRSGQDFCGGHINFSEWDQSHYHNVCQKKRRVRLGKAMTIETEIRDVVMSQEMQEECDCLLVTIPMEHIISLSFICRFSPRVSRNNVTHSRLLTSKICKIIKLC